MTFRWCLLGVLLTHFCVHSQQLQFNKRATENTMVFQYQWLDHQQQPRELGFALSKDLIQSQYRNTKSYQPEIAQRHIYVALMKSAQGIDPKEARVNVVKRQQGFEIQVQASSQQIVEKYSRLFAEKQELAFEDYLYQNHYTRFENHFGKRGVVPDHRRYIIESHAVALVIAQALYNQLEENSNTRDYVNLLLSWVQSIPYNELESRLASNGSGFYAPVDVLSNNLGDCDSKVTLTAALMRALLPGLSIEIVYLPEHAMLAANLGVRADEVNIDLRGSPHVLLEPTGPAKLPIGKIAEQSARAIANGTYTTLNIP